MLKRLKQVNRGLLELCLGILFLGMLCLAVGVFLVDAPFLYGMALSIGVLLAWLTALHMYRTLERTLDLGADAVKAVTAANLIRYACIVIVFMVVWLIGKLNPLFTFLGLMTLKFAAYMQPLTHKVCNKVFHEVDPIPQPLIEPEKQALAESLTEPVSQPEAEESLTNK